MTDLPYQSALETIDDRLENAEAILAYDGFAKHRLSGVRTLLRALHSRDLSTSNMRKQWTGIVEAMLRLSDSTATVDQVRRLHDQIAQLRDGIRRHQGFC